MSFPPPKPSPQAGETWFIQRCPGNPLLTVEIDEVTARTVLVSFAPDGSIQPRPNAMKLRFLIRDLRWIERVAGDEPPATPKFIHPSRSHHETGTTHER